METIICDQLATEVQFSIVELGKDVKLVLHLQRNHHKQTL